MAIAIICNSANPDMRVYLSRAVEGAAAAVGKARVAAITNRAIADDVATKCGRVIVGSVSRRALTDPRLLADVPLLLRLGKALRGSGIEIAHFTTVHVSNVPQAAVLRKMGIRLAFSLHDTTPHPGRKAPIIRTYNRLVIGAFADVVVVYSHQARRAVQGKHVEYIPLGGFPAGFEGPKSGRSVLFFGRIDRYKGLENVLRIAKEAARRRLPLKFRIAGAGWVPELGELGALSNVELINRFIKPEEISAIFADAAFLLLPYTRATQSGLIPLAYGHATPVIVYDVGALGEYVRDGTTGFILRPGDDDAMLARLSGTPAYRILEMSQACIEEWQSFYSPEVARKQYADLYMRIRRSVIATHAVSLR